MRSLFFLFTFTVCGAMAASLDGNYKMQSWICQDGSQPSTADVISRVVDSTYLNISGSKMVTTIKFDAGCEVSWSGDFKISNPGDGPSLDLSEMVGVATTACQYSPKEIEPAITFGLKTTKETLILDHKASLTDSCSTGSIRTYQRLLPAKQILIKKSIRMIAKK